MPNPPKLEEEKKPRKPRDPNAPKRVLMPKVKDGHKRIYFDVPEAVHTHLEKEGGKDFRDANQFAYVTIMKHAGVAHDGTKLDERAY